MHRINPIKYTFLPLAILAAGLFTSCKEDIEFAANESTYLSAIQINGMLLDETTNKNTSMVELRSDEQSTNIVFRLSQKPQKGVDVTIAVDEAYVATYNAIHGTDFDMFPTENVTITNNGVCLLAPDDTKTPGLKVTLTAFDDMEEDKTYIVPLTATSFTEGVTFSDMSQHAVLLVQDYRHKSTANKGKDAVKSVIYFEVNDSNPLNALEFKTASGKYFFDDVVLFAANINWDAKKKRVYVANNDNVQFLLDHNEEYLQPLRKAGMRVIISILGNHDEAGVAQLSEMGAKEFARELAAYCRGYNLDGVAFDDEYSSSPNLSNPWLTNKSVEAGSRLMYECKKAMPEKIVSLYSLGSLYAKNLTIIDGVEPGQYCDYSVADYGKTEQPGTGMTLKQCAGMSIELFRDKGDASSSTARSKKNAGYGYYMFFSPTPPSYKSDEGGRDQLTYLQNVCSGLYDESLIRPTYYYPKNSTVRTPR